MKPRIETTPLRNSRGDLIKHLVIDDVIWMSNEDDEYQDIERALATAKGNCFIGGLGLGLIVDECAKLDCVKRIDVVEIDPDIIDLYNNDNPKVNIYTGNAKEYFPSSKYNWMYLDTYLEPLDDGVRDYREFVKNAQKHLDNNGVIECWLKNKILG